MFFLKRSRYFDKDENIFQQLPFLSRKTHIFEAIKLYAAIKSSNCHF